MAALDSTRVSRLAIRNDAANSGAATSWAIEPRLISWKPGCSTTSAPPKPISTAPMR